MMYPRQKSQKSATQTNFTQRKGLSQGQKSELRRQIVDRLSKKYGIDLTEYIDSKVNEYVQNTGNITVEGLQKLENEIKQAQMNGNNTKQEEGAMARDYNDDDEGKSGISKISGASNFDKVDQYTRKQDKKDGDESNQSKYKNQKSKKVENDLGFLNEQNQWAAIYKYNKYLYDKESEIVKQREEERKKKIRAELDLQVKEKEVKKFESQKEEDAFFNNQQIQMNMFDQREQEKIEKQKALKLMEKKERDKQIKENRRQRRRELQQEKQLDAYMMQKVKDELEDEQQFQLFKKEHQYQIMKRIMAENDERKKKLLQDELQDRNENIKLMDAYCRLLDQQDFERTKALKERDEKIKQYQQRALEMQAQEMECNCRFTLNPVFREGGPDGEESFEVRGEEGEEIEGAGEGAGAAREGLEGGHAALPTSADGGEGEKEVRGEDEGLGAGVALEGGQREVLPV